MLMKHEEIGKKKKKTHTETDKLIDTGTNTQSHKIKENNLLLTITWIN